MIRSLLTAAALVAAAVGVADPVPEASAGGPPTLTLTFVRHAQSEGNASGRIDTSTPGPGLTPLGTAQAAEVATALDGLEIDGIYASTMVRTQQTADPLALRRAEPVVVLPGLREVEAGQAEGQPEAAAAGYFTAPMQWLRGDRTARIPGSISGDEFDARFDAAVQTIADSGDRDAVVFSHGAAIMLWVTMNVANPQPNLLVEHPLDNTDRVVVVGSPERGWQLLEWDGIAVAP
ncbi:MULTISPECIES: histidine phosphatase family protein [Mycobacteriaceae]|uniref:histidine phosphatase family protein n=1 Tax=Mycobacteriaceae TaxID=1762 RepID=UPI000800596B|nr:MULTISPECIES: histidine phosphatase family protein [Mycobacteriaceae]MCK0176138.1 histidine phosphatase family protein [Mycolicibacterium sp. F2034L]OBB58280.1 histidine phosphatase family protein [Mycobacterium sp. 852013-51886_SCH5428379]